MSIFKFWGAKQRSVSPKAGAELRQVIKEADEILTTQAGKKLLTVQRSRIAEISGAVRKITEEMSTIKNMITTIGQVTLQTAEWSVEIEKAVAHFKQQVALTEEFSEKLAAYESAYQELQRLQETQQGAEARSRALDAYEQILKAVESLKADINEFGGKAGNIINNIDLQRKNAVNLTNKTKMIAEAATKMADSAESLVETIDSMRSKYGTVKGKLKTEIVEQLDQTVRDSERIVKAMTR